MARIQAPQPAARRPAPVGAVLFAMVFPTLATWLYFVQAGPTGARWLYTVCKVVQFVFPLLWVGASSWRTLLPTRVVSRGSAVGLAFGLGVAMAAPGVAWILAARGGMLSNAGLAIARKLATFGIESRGEFLALAFFYSLIHSFLEEYYWRWFVHGELRMRMAKVPATAVSSLSFTSHHVILLVIYFWPAWPLVVALCLATAVGGAVWAWLYEESGSLSPPWLSHLLVDAGLMAMGFTLVFGGGGA